VHAVTHREHNSVPFTRATDPADSEGTVELGAEAGFDPHALRTTLSPNSQDMINSCSNDPAGCRHCSDCHQLREEEFSSHTDQLVATSERPLMLHSGWYTIAVTFTCSATAAWPPPRQSTLTLGILRLDAENRSKQLRRRVLD
jgi:hypothetical protein